MINNVQFTGNPIKKGVKLAQGSIESFIASRKNINPAKDAVMEARKESAAMARKPVGEMPVQKLEKDVVEIHPSRVQMEESYARSFGVPEEVINPKKVDSETNIVDLALKDVPEKTEVTNSIDYIA